ncbi:unnamed protein product [Euphydryas editha]|uniref:Uncharacterized protein n=1 Tax=Euphydryas editha TaxID=104508 RepID=A0AAU9TQE8_EUPED|nr:unnamed protein product [Euphydryas editha]
MELLSFVKEVLQNAAERAASYRLGQTVLRYMDRALWILEKSARWAVPPPLDQEERPQPELIRPLPWVFFFALLIVLRITRESISLVNLTFGKPPLRSADVVTYIQSKRRYLRTLKYQGNRVMRTRSELARESWFSRVQALFEFTMCFRRPHYGNNNTQLSNGDEVLVVKRNKRGRETDAGSSMERLIEKMMVDIDADSDDSSGYTLTNVTNPSSDRSEDNTEYYQDTQQSNKNTEENSNSSLEENNKTPSSESSAYEDPDEIEIPNDVYRKSRTIDVKEISIDFIRNEMSTNMEQVIKSQHKIDTAVKATVINKASGT